MLWNFTLVANASGTINGSTPFNDALVRVKLTECQLAPGAIEARNIAIFSGQGVLLLDDRRFAFDPNRYGLLLERDELAYGDWLSVAFGTADSPLILAGFGLVRNTRLQDGYDLRGESGTGLNCRATLEALDGETLDMTSIQLERGTNTPQLSLRRHG